MEAPLLEPTPEGIETAGALNAVLDTVVGS